MLDDDAAEQMRVRLQNEPRYDGYRKFYPGMVLPNLTLVERRDEATWWAICHGCGVRRIVNPAHNLRMPGTTGLCRQCYEATHPVERKPRLCKHCGLTDETMFGRHKTDECRRCERRRYRNGLDANGKPAHRRGPNNRSPR